MRRFFSIIGKLPPDEKQWMEDFYELVDNERLDAEVNRAVLQGSWPSAVEQLEHSLQEAREYAEFYGYDTRKTTRSI